MKVPLDSERAEMHHLHLHWESNAIYTSSVVTNTVTVEKQSGRNQARSEARYSRIGQSPG